jgi:hypothetical protein
LSFDRIGRDDISGLIQLECKLQPFNGINGPGKVVTMEKGKTTT